jgi:hypothetical protein
MYKEYLEMNESKAGIDWDEITLDNLVKLIDEIPGWDYPLAIESMSELAKRAGIDTDEFFQGGEKDYNDLFSACADVLNIE